MTQSKLQEKLYSRCQARKKFKPSQAREITGPRLGCLFLLLMFYGWAIIPLMYLFSFVFRSASKAFVVLTIFNLVTGLVTLLTVFILSAPDLSYQDIAHALIWAFLVLPNFCLGQGMEDMFRNHNAIDMFNSAVDVCVATYHDVPRKFCEANIRKLCGDGLQFQDNYLAWDNPGIGRHLIFLAWEGIFFFALVLLIEYRVFDACTRSLARLRSNSTGVFTMETSTLADDEDVLAEKERILTSEDNDDVLVIKELSKVFAGNGRRGPLVAVDRLSLGIPISECFGLLGINGAGNTTTFRMLTGDEIMSGGTALVEDFDIRTSMNRVRQRIGYCPQFDALIDQMTGRELLYMYARLRGVPDRTLSRISLTL